LGIVSKRFSKYAVIYGGSPNLKIILEEEREGKYIRRV